MSEGLGNGILDDSLDMLADLKLEGPSESESSSTKPESDKPAPPDIIDETCIDSLQPNPIFHPPSGAPYCNRCIIHDHQIYFSRKCKACEERLNTASVSEVFAIMRQWSIETQCQLLFYIEKLIKLGCGVCDYDTVSGCTLLHFAARCGSKNAAGGEVAAKCTQYLLENGSNIHMKDLWTGMMPLHYAALFNVPSVIEKILMHKSLLDFSVDYTCEEFDNGTALHIACTNLSYEATKVLLEHGADVELKNALDLIPKEVIPDEDVNDPDSHRSQTVRKMKKLLSSYEEKACISLPNYDDVHGKALLLAMGVKIGDQVSINDEKQGRLMFCGRVEFARGIWAGVELSPGDGKHDGSIYGITYFKCPPGSGIFVPVTKISKPGKGPRNKPQRPLDIKYEKPDLSNITSKINTGRRTAMNKNNTSVLRSSRSRSNSICSDMGDDKLAEGDRVVVGGHKKGVIRYIGETKFAPGEWYGVELDRPIGKNDGSVDGERYFACKPKHGVFCTVAKLRRAPLTRADSNDSLNSLNSFNQDTSWTLRVKKLSGGHYSASSSIGSLNSSINDMASGTSTPRRKPRSRSSSLSRMKSTANKAKKNSEYKLEEGMTVLYNNDIAELRYIGAVDFSDGCWLGLELKTASGKNDGSVQGKRYFTCKPKHGVMVKPSRISVKGINGAKLLGDQHQSLSSTKLDLSDDHLIDSNSKASDT